MKMQFYLLLCSIFLQLPAASLCKFIYLAQFFLFLQKNKFALFSTGTPETMSAKSPRRLRPFTKLKKFN